MTEPKNPAPPSAPSKPVVAAKKKPAASIAARGPRKAPARPRQLKVPPSATAHFKGVVEEFSGHMQSRIGHLFENEKMEADGNREERHGIALQKANE